MNLRKKVIEDAKKKYDKNYTNITDTQLLCETLERIIEEQNKKIETNNEKVYNLEQRIRQAGVRLRKS